MNLWNSLIGPVIPMLILLPFVGGIMWAGNFCKNWVSQFFVGLLLGVGIICVIAGVAFAGCLVIVGLNR